MIETSTYKIAQLVPYINWLYFFFAWQLPSYLADIVKKTQLNDCVSTSNSLSEAQKEEGEKLYQDAMKMLEYFNKNYYVFAKVGIFKANSKGDDILIYHEQKKTVLSCLRQQHEINEKEPNLCLSDYLIPAVKQEEDCIGVFSTTVSQEMENSFYNDPYKHMLTQTLCDRLAEAAAEKIHLETRKNFWGYAPNEDLSPKELFAEKYQGIRPAVGYPSLPDQSVNFTLNELIDMESIGIHITENGAMKPHASVSGLMFAHPKAHYFTIGKIGNDQLQDYAHRRHLTEIEARKFLSANL